MASIMQAIPPIAAMVSVLSAWYARLHSARQACSTCAVRILFVTGLRERGAGAGRQAGREGGRERVCV